MDTQLWHATNKENLPSILDSGIRSGSYWGIRTIAQKWADMLIYQGRSVVLICKPLSAFNLESLDRDENMQEFPMLKKNAPWISRGNWRSSLKHLGSIQYDQVMPIELKDIHPHSFKLNPEISC